MENSNKIKDYKTSSYSDETFLSALHLFRCFDELKMLDLEAIDIVNNLCLDALEKQIINGIKDLPFNGRFERVERNKNKLRNCIRLNYIDDNLTLACSITFYNPAFTFNCENIIGVRVDEGSTLNIDDIRRTQKEITMEVYRILGEVNEKLLDSNYIKEK